MAVRQMVDDLPHTPATLTVGRIELRGLQSSYSLADPLRCALELRGPALTLSARDVSFRPKFADRIA